MFSQGLVILNLQDLLAYIRLLRISLWYILILVKRRLIINFDFFKASLYIVIICCHKMQYCWLSIAPISSKSIITHYLAYAIIIARWIRFLNAGMFKRTLVSSVAIRPILALSYNLLQILRLFFLVDRLGGLRRNLRVSIRMVKSAFTLDQILALSSVFAFFLILSWPLHVNWRRLIVRRFISFHYLLIIRISKTLIMKIK